MSIDSTAVFAARVRLLGLGDYWNKFVTAGWTTLGEFAFSSNYTPGQQDDQDFVTEFFFLSNANAVK